ncbi:phage minor tail protein L [Salmonella enterica]|nr:phage minor tail protein L [Salmonella enterica]EHF6859169.1 phage minor tail protein L [Salmonella enterica subsp. enterica serovar Panama]ELS1935884.1 phage minor tail protein L [Salmonella enterica]
MQDIPQSPLSETTKTEQPARIVLWELDLTLIGGERYFFCNEANEKGEPITWQGRQYRPYPVKGSGFEMKGKGASNRPSIEVSNLFGLVAGIAEELNRLVGARVYRRQVYSKFLDAVNFTAGNSNADPEQEIVMFFIVEQLSALNAKGAKFTLASPVEADGAVINTNNSDRAHVIFSRSKRRQ